jgi:diguanylate cyclase (GGDEF)-like protein
MFLSSESIPAVQVDCALNGSKLIHFRAALAEIMAEWQPIETTVTRALNALMTSLPGGAPAFFRFSEGRFFCLSAPQAPEDLLAAMHGLRVPERDGCDAGEAPFWSYEPGAADVRTDAAWTPLRPLLSKHGLAGCWSSPVFSPSGEALGAVVIFRVEARPPEDDEAELLNCAGRILALLLEQRLLIDDLRYQAEHDPLTGAINSVAFQKLLEREISAARPDHQAVSLICLNVDRIRSVNDLLGRNVGDRLLRDLASRLSAALSPEDALARTDGNEFVALLRKPAPGGGAMKAATRLAGLLRTPFPVGDSEIQLRASVGLASFPEHATDARSLLQAVQATVHRIKNSGRNRVEVCDPRLDHADLNRARLESALQGALDRGEMLLYYQPKIWLATGMLESAEALMRWRSADLGLISPALFIPLAEETGEIVELGRWAIQESCCQAVRWHELRGRPQRIAVNVSPVQLSHPELLSQLRAAIEACAVDPAKIELEITESSFAGDYSRVRKSLQTLRELGVQIALDDFGTGYSSLSILRELPFDTLKIDKSFLDAAEAGTASSASIPRRMLARMIDLGHDLGKNVVVEGVETQAQVELLMELSCDIAQGYLFGRPIPAADWDARANPPS